MTLTSLPVRRSLKSKKKIAKIAYDEGGFCGEDSLALQPNYTDMIEEERTEWISEFNENDAQLSDLDDYWRQQLEKAKEAKRTCAKNFLERVSHHQCLIEKAEKDLAKGGKKESRCPLEEKSQQNSGVWEAFVGIYLMHTNPDAKVEMYGPRHPDKDKGRDLVMTQKNVKTIVECKCYARTCDPVVVRALVGAMVLHDGQEGILASFKKSDNLVGVAEEYTQRNFPIRLISAEDVFHSLHIINEDEYYESDGYLEEEHEEIYDSAYSLLLAAERVKFKKCRRS
mmetsp:Transcript_12887/g.19824  ORF Transcript_12887/g.19824 Transcript_12887/m.19824 type:complete len:283 (-) Transcript_12887:54-902(-)|eukprot:CAMPEP_0201522912 /NCGR_PEP_ID=MMETSP0161_2-20130828/18630_1 /ASSEMBLY_ACC=CAM_ASM_000251 /TAXON_ID=180227 /ORGANISM="Neoparamoeba aestuarina, Strain SoJaBio B1-5/56/2" /LENGTH=282 /DNA_ID=CAMNT_0047921879 /DNA_START=274 /DNA_END=1122 /DNA_ORIENTATION=-